MFTKVEGKLKAIATINFICGVSLTVLCLLIMLSMDDDLIIPGLITGAIFVLISLILSWFIYAFAELLENTKEINRALQIEYKEDLLKEAELQKRIEQEKAAQNAKEQEASAASTKGTHYWD